MVAQAQNDEWETPPSRNGSTLSLDYRQQPPVVRTPPSYFDAVRSRHSLSQPDSVKTEKPPSPQHVKYNSLPRPLPQRLQTYPSNIYDVQQPPRTAWPDGPLEKMSPENGFSRPADTNSGFQVYTRPPGPANHVPLSSRNQLLMMSNSSTLPRGFPRDAAKLEMTAPNVPRDVHQPLSIIVKHDFSMGPPMSKQGDYQKKMMRPPHDQTRFAVPPPMRRAQPPLPPDTTKHHPPVAGHMNGPSKTNSLPRNQQHGNQANMAQYRHDNMPSKPQQYPSYHYPNVANYPRYSRSGTLPFQHPRRDYIVEPAICIRTGPLGSYPEPGQVQNTTMKHPPKPLHTSKSQNLLECAEMPPSQAHFTHIRKHDPPNVDLAQPPMPTHKLPHPPRSSLPSRPLPPSSPTNHQPLMKNALPKQQANAGDSFRHQEYSRSSTLPRKMSREKVMTDFSVPHPRDFSVEHSAVFQHPSSTNGLQNTSKTSPFSPNKLHHHHLTTPLSNQHFSQKMSDDDDSHSSTPSKGLSRETPEEAGLVMIVESRELNNRVNSIVKDLVKPTPRIPISPTFALPASSSAASNGMPMSLYLEKPYSPHSSFSHVNTQMCGYQPQISTNEPMSPPKHHASSEDVNAPVSKNFCSRDVFRAVPGNTRTVDTQPNKPQNGFLLRRTPLSSSTASLSSEISSVCSRSRKSQDIFQKRVPSSRQKSLERGGSPDDKGKKNEISNSPWVREEKEELQKQQILGARRARDEEISYLEALPDRTMKQDEWLRILRLEREFQRRAEEIEDDDDEDDEVLLERAEHRERMLMMQEEAQTDSATRSRSSTQSSSDQWLVNSQAKQSKRNKDHGGSFSLNGSFEIEHFNDLLETMNMSPVIRDEDSCETSANTSSESPSRPVIPKAANSANEATHGSNVMESKGSYSLYQTSRPVPAPRISKTVSPVPHTPNTEVSTRTHMDFCFPIDNATPDPSETFKLEPRETRPSSEGYSAVYEERRQSLKDAARKSNQCSTRVDFIQHGSQTHESSLNGQSKMAKNISSSDVKFHPEQEQQHSKLALRVPLKSMGKEKGQEKGLRENMVLSPTKQKEAIVMKRMSNGEPYYRNFQDHDIRSKNKSPPAPVSCKSESRPVSDSNLGLLYSPMKIQNGMSKSLNTNFEGKSSEYKKIWNSRPEKLTFMDKIKKFSLQAGEDDLPKDKVKNSRAQRELELKFNGELVKNAGQSVA